MPLASARGDVIDIDADGKNVRTRWSLVDQHGGLLNPRVVDRTGSPSKLPVKLPSSSFQARA
ncbi:MAG TPA: hypothetical protein VLK65_25330 [Vicinamibacteria bacterium]|nr:hypothetical protein [Vicinamibacteria bacterium]